MFDQRALPDIDWDNADPMTIFKALWGVERGLPFPDIVTVHQAKRLTRERSTNIFANFRQLKAILDRHEACIKRRWAKKTKEQRRKILLIAWPNMSAAHRPDFEAFRLESPEDRQADSRFKQAFMWPYINLEDLAKPRTLLLFLNARGRNTPDVFAYADEEAARFGRVARAIRPPFLDDDYAMYLSGRNSPERYGEILPYNVRDKVWDDWVSQRGKSVGDGLQILQTQQRLYRFLVRCCQEIMHDISAEALTSTAYPVLPEPLAVTEKVSGLAPLAVMAAQAPYRVPGNLDLDRLCSILAAKSSAAEDHLWTLREDPGYFADCAQDACEHHQANLPDTMGGVHPLFNGECGGLDASWSMLLSDIVAHAYRMVEIWNELHDQVINLKALQSTYAKSISVAKDLPEEYLLALLKFNHYVNIAAKGPLIQLRDNFSGSPPARRFFARCPYKRTASGKVIVQDNLTIERRKCLKVAKVEDELIFLINALASDGDQLHGMGQITVVDELERLMQSEPKAMAIISPLLAAIIADLSVVTEASRQINQYQPWAQVFESLLVDRKGGLEQEYKKKTEDWIHFHGTCERREGVHLVRLGMPSGGKFYYPVDKRRTETTTEAMRKAEGNLDAFWAGVDRRMQHTAGKRVVGLAVRRLLSQPRILQRTPQWIEPMKAPRKSVMPAERLCKPLADVYFELEHRTEATLDKSSTLTVPRNKHKTRKPGDPLINNTTLQERSTNITALAASTPQSTITVDARALKVFHTLFHTPSISATPGEVSWTDFLHAMTSAGFSAEKLYGSVWQFEPLIAKVTRSIQFHDPHPSVKMPYRVARRFGRRLERSYAWFGDMFVLKEKGGQKRTSGSVHGAAAVTVLAHSTPVSVVGCICDRLVETVTQ
ncbi:hypothetical protein B0A50_03592 [Salinomyces thailandicus]|uniref:Uncharacterized protein n=1 Tax=Salinomyces thailandicus TaxID=706561 RepID=A0A4V5N4X6_9PEZI|nr:hypothetical protein B0A50_03592 [Salinomyces thailandica]